MIIAIKIFIFHVTVPGDNKIGNQMLKKLKNIRRLKEKLQGCGKRELFICGRIRSKCGKELGQVGHQNKYLLFQKRTFLGTTRILCFQGEEMNFKEPKVAGYDHDWSYYKLQ